MKKRFIRFDFSRIVVRVLTIPKPNLKRFSYSLILLLFLLSMICSSCKSPSQLPHLKQKKIAVLQFGTHPVIDAVIEGFRSRIGEFYGDKVELTYYNGNFDLSTIGVLAKQMVASEADVLVSVTTPATGQLIGANRGLKPLIYTFVSEPEALGYKGPGSLPNTTGLSDRVNYKRSLDLIRALLPTAKKIGFLLTASEPNAVTIHREFLQIAPKYGFEIITATIGQATDIRTAAETLAPRVDLFLFGGDNTIASGFEALLIPANARKLPVFACDEESVTRGAIAAVSVDYKDMGKSTAEMCAAVLGDADPNRIPYKQYTASRLILNAKTARYLGLVFPDAIKYSADLILD